MKLLYLLLIIYLMIFNSMAYSEDRPDRARSENPHIRLKQYAHPEPEFQEPMMLVPEGEKPNPSLFDNIPASVDANGTDIIQNESSIAVNPVNPLNLISSAVDYRNSSSTWVYISNDGGRTWINKNLGKVYPGWTSSNDPSVTYDRSGTGYLVYGGFGNISSDSTVLFGENGVFMSKTTDGGTTWKTHIPVIAHRGLQTLDSTFEDKYYITSDNSITSPYEGHLYIPWKRVAPRDSATQIVLSKSTDKGDTWSAPIAISPRISGSSEDTTYGQSFPLCVTGPDGTVYVVWNNGLEHGVGFARSTDGGITFSNPEIIIRYDIFGETKELEGQGYRHSVKGKVRAEAYPSIVCDITGGSRNGNLYLTWAADNYPNIYFAYSSDKGENWSEPVIVHSDTTNDQLWQWIALDPINGDLAVMYFDSRNDSTNQMVETYVSYSSDGGITWIDRRVSDVYSDLRLNPFRGNSFAGDYSGCAFYNGMIYPSWVDMRNAMTNIADNDVFTARVNVNAPEPPSDFIAKIVPDKPDVLELSWKAPLKRSFGQPLTGDYSYELFRNDTLIKVLQNDVLKYTDNNLRAFEEYKYSINTIAGADTSVRADSKAFAGGSPYPAPPLLTNESIGNEQNQAEIIVKLPVLRTDSLTPITNLAGIKLFRDSILISDLPLSPGDTGRVISISDTCPERGWYTYTAKVYENWEVPDLGIKESAPGNQYLLYVGPMIIGGVPDNFDELPLPKYYLTKNWQVNNEIYYNSPNSIAITGEKGYLPNKRDTLMLFPTPYTGGSGSGHYYFTFQHAAIVENKDSCIAEYYLSADSTWRQLGNFNIDSYPQWGDGENGPEDMVHEEFPLSFKDMADGYVIFRFRFYSDYFKNNKGWFIDNAFMGIIDSKYDEPEFDEKLMVYPNPALRYVTIESQDLVIQNYQLFDILGTNVNSSTKTIYQSNGKIMLDVSELSSGVYYFKIQTNEAPIYRSIHISR